MEDKRPSKSPVFHPSSLINISPGVLPHPFHPHHLNYFDRLGRRQEALLSTSESFFAANNRLKSPFGALEGFQRELNSRSPASSSSVSPPSPLPLHPHLHHPHHPHLSPLSHHHHRQPSLYPQLHHHKVNHVAAPHSTTSLSSTSSSTPSSPSASNTTTVGMIKMTPPSTSSSSCTSSPFHPVVGRVVAGGGVSPSKTSSLSDTCLIQQNKSSNNESQQEQQHLQAHGFYQSSSSSSHRSKTKICGVCGDRAKSYHFGGISCDSCKAFFRRSVQNDAYKNFHCPYEGQCDINITSRKCCQFCRFKKCLSIGMEKSWVMTEEERLQMLKTRLEKRQKQESESSESSSRHHQASVVPSPSTGDRGITTAITSTTQESLSGNLSNGSSSPSNSLSSPDKAINISGNNPTPTVDVTARSQSSLKRGRYEPRLEEVQLYLTNEEVQTIESIINQYIRSCQEIPLNCCWKEQSQREEEEREERELQKQEEKEQQENQNERDVEESIVHDEDGHTDDNDNKVRAAEIANSCLGMSGDCKVILDNMKGEKRSSHQDEQDENQIHNKKEKSKGMTATVIDDGNEKERYQGLRNDANERVDREDASEMICLDVCLQGRKKEKNFTVTNSHHHHHSHPLGVCINDTNPGIQHKLAAKSIIQENHNTDDHREKEEKHDTLLMTILAKDKREAEDGTMKDDHDKRQEEIPQLKRDTTEKTPASTKLQMPVEKASVTSSALSSPPSSSASAPSPTLSPQNDTITRTTAATFPPSPSSTTGGEIAETSSLSLSSPSGSSSIVINTNSNSFNNNHSKRNNCAEGDGNHCHHHHSHHRSREHQQHTLSTKERIFHILFTCVQQFTHFALSLPSFATLSIQDQITLLKTASLEVCFLRSGVSLDSNHGAWSSRPRHSSLFPPKLLTNVSKKIRISESSETTNTSSCLSSSSSSSSESTSRTSWDESETLNGDKGRKDEKKMLCQPDDQDRDDDVNDRDREGTFILFVSDLEPFLPQTLFDKYFNFIRSIRSLQVDEVSLTLLSLILLFNPDRSGLKDVVIISHLQDSYIRLLKSYMGWHFGRDVSNFLFGRLFLKLPELRELGEYFTDLSLEEYQKEVIKVQDNMSNSQRVYCCQCLPLFQEIGIKRVTRYHNNHKDHKDHKDHNHHNHHRRRAWTIKETVGKVRNVSMMETGTTLKTMATSTSTSTSSSPASLLLTSNSNNNKNNITASSSLSPSPQSATLERMMKDDDDDASRSSSSSTASSTFPASSPPSVAEDMNNHSQFITLSPGK